MIPNLSKQIMDMVMDGCSMIPIHGCPTKYFEENFKYWKKFEFYCDNAALNEAIYVASKTLEAVISMYKETHAFSDPVFTWKPDGEFGLKVGLMEMDLYKHMNPDEANKKEL